MNEIIVSFSCWLFEVSDFGMLWEQASTKSVQGTINENTFYYCSVVMTIAVFNELLIDDNHLDQTEGHFIIIFTSSPDHWCNNRSCSILRSILIHIRNGDLSVFPKSLELRTFHMKNGLSGHVLKFQRSLSLELNFGISCWEEIPFVMNISIYDDFIRNRSEYLLFISKCLGFTWNVVVLVQTWVACG